MIADALREHLWTIQMILMFDTHSAHLADLMWRACYNAGFWQLLMPALTTKYFQPLDTHVFAVYKLRLQRAYHDVGITIAVNFSTLLDRLLTTIRDVIHGYLLKKLRLSEKSRTSKNRCIGEN